MNLVFVNPHFGPVLGGIQKDMLCLAREMIALGDRVTFVTTYDEFPEGRVDLSRPLTYDLPPGLEIVRLEGHCRTRLRNFHPANPPLFLPGLTEAVLRCDPDGVIFFNIGWPLTVASAHPPLATTCRSCSTAALTTRTSSHAASTRGAAGSSFEWRPSVTASCRTPDTKKCRSSATAASLRRRSPWCTPA